MHLKIQYLFQTSLRDDLICRKNMPTLYGRDLGWCILIDLIIMISNGIYIHEIHLGLQMSRRVSQGRGSPLFE